METKTCTHGTRLAKTSNLAWKCSSEQCLARYWLDENMAVGAVGPAFKVAICYEKISSAILEHWLPPTALCTFPLIDKQK